MAAGLRHGAIDYARGFPARLGERQSCRRRRKAVCRNGLHHLSSRRWRRRALAQRPLWLESSLADGSTSLPTKATSRIDFATERKNCSQVSAINASFQGQLTEEQIVASLLHQVSAVATGSREGRVAPYGKK